MIQAFKRRSFLHSMTRTGCFRESTSVSHTKMVGHAAHGVLLSDRHEDDLQVKASNNPLCQRHSDHDSGDTRKDSITSIIS